MDYGIPPVGPKWFVCVYGTSVSWWEPLDEKELACKLKVVKKNSQGIMEATLTCK